MKLKKPQNEVLPESAAVGADSYDNKSMATEAAIEAAKMRLPHS